MRILALNWRCMRHPQAGGSEMNLFEQAKRWVGSGHEVTVFTSDPGRDIAPERDEMTDGVRIIRRGGKFGVYALAALFLMQNRRSFDAVLDVANGVPFFARLFSGARTVLLVHHFHDRQWFVELPYLAAAFGRFLETKVVPRVYRGAPVIAVSPTTRDALLGTGFVEEELRVVYNGVERPPQTTHDAVGRDPHRVAYVGRIKRYKRLDLLVRAVAALRRDRLPDIRLDIAGDGDALDDVRRLVSKLGLEGSVELHGFVEDDEKAGILGRASVFATPSMHEGWGLSVIEANAHGLPAVAYDVPGLRVSVRDGETGLLAEDDGAFVEGIARIMEDDTLRARLSENALGWSENFSWERCAEETLAVLRGDPAPGYVLSVAPVSGDSIVSGNVGARG